MPTVDKRTGDNVFTDGSVSGLQVLLTDTEAQQVYGDSAVGGWYAFAETDSSGVMRETDEEQIKNEAGEIVKNVRQQDDGVINATLLQTDTPTMKLLDLLSKSPHRYRIGYPVGTIEVSDGSGGTIEVEGTQLYGLRNGFAPSSFEVNGEDGEQRTRDIEIRGSRKGGKEAIVYGDVDPDDETTWPAELEEFKTGAAA